MNTNSKRNNGFVTIVMVGDEKFELDGYVRKDVMDVMEGAPGARLD